jgi:hypothetical protein
VLKGTTHGVKDLISARHLARVGAPQRFVVPIKKLRRKSDRQMPMHGNDVIGVDTRVKPVRVLKGECKSGATFSKHNAEDRRKGVNARDPPDAKMEAHTTSTVI